MVYSWNKDKIPEGLNPLHASEEDLSNFATLRHRTRINYPGLCAYFFECVLDTILQEVVGWDVAADEPREEGGMFGKPLAYTASVKEQGRRTLHAHIMIWIQGLKEVHQKLHSSH